MAYSPTTWTEGVTKLGPTNMNKIETALTKMPYGPDATAHQVPVSDGAGGWTMQKVTASEIAAAAAIAYSQLALSGSVTNADIATAAAIAYSKLNLAGSIVNADIAAAAAIAISKLAGYPADGTKALFGDGTWKSGSTVLKKTGITDVVNTVTTTDLLGGAVTLPALTTTSIVRVRAVGDYLNNSGAGSAITFELKLGATTLWKDTIGAGFTFAAAFRRAWEINCLIVNEGATSSQQMDGSFLFGSENAALTGIGSISGVHTYPMAGNASHGEWNAIGGSATEDTTATKALVLNITHGVAASTISGRCTGGLVEIL